MLDKTAVPETAKSTTSVSCKFVTPLTVRVFRFVDPVVVKEFSVAKPEVERVVVAALPESVATPVTARVLDKTAVPETAKSTTSVSCKSVFPETVRVENVGVLLADAVVPSNISFVVVFRYSDFNELGSAILRIGSINNPVFALSKITLVAFKIIEFAAGLFSPALAPMQIEFAPANVYPAFLPIAIASAPCLLYPA